MYFAIDEISNIGKPFGKTANEKPCLVHWNEQLTLEERITCLEHDEILNQKM